MPHSKAAASNARTKMFAMTTHLGLPSLMLTITPTDDFNFRIRIYSDKYREDKSGQASPSEIDNYERINEFITECNDIRTKYPGLCSWDFEQVLTVTIEHLIGWDSTKGINKENHGIFGDVHGYCHADEEQGRKTLHAHILIWVKEFNDLMNNLHDDTPSEIHRIQLKNYMTKIVQNEFHGPSSAACNDCETRLTPCLPQQLRNLRHETNMDDNSILYCTKCEKNMIMRHYV